MKNKVLILGVSALLAIAVMIILAISVPEVAKNVMKKDVDAQVDAEIGLNSIIGSEEEEAAIPAIILQNKDSSPAPVVDINIEKNRKEAKEAAEVFIKETKECYKSKDEESERCKEIKKNRILIEEIGSAANVKILTDTQQEFYGWSDVAIKACDKDYFCQAFLVSCHREESIWNIYEIRALDSDDIEYYSKKENLSTSLVPSKLVKRFFSLIKEKKQDEAEKMLSPKTSPTGISIERLVETNKHVSFDSSEILNENTIEYISLLLVFVDDSGYIINSKGNSDVGINVCKCDEKGWTVKGSFLTG